MYKHKVLLTVVALSAMAAWPMSALADSSIDRERDTARIFVEQLLHPLKFAGPPKIEVLDQEAFRNRQLIELKRESAARQRDWKVLTSLGLIRGPGAAEDVLRGMLARSLDGSYHFDSRTIFIPAGQSERVKVLVHEMVHALFHEHLDVPALRKGVENDDDRETAFLALTEGIATFAEVAFEAWQNDENRGDGPWKPSPDVFARAMQRARADVAMTYGGSSDSIESDTIRRFVQFPYSHGLKLIATAGQEHAARLGPWIVEMHDATRLPRSSREILHEGRPPAPVEIPSLATVLGGALQGTSWAVVEDGSLGELTLRLWWRLDLTEGAWREHLPLGLSCDRLLVIEDPSNGRLAGIAVLVFDSDFHAREASRLAARSTVAGGAGVEQIGRALIVPIGDLPNQFRNDVVAAIRAQNFSAPPIAPSELARFHLAEFARHGEIDAWRGFIRTLTDCTPLARTQLLPVLAELCFITSQPETPEELALEESAFWAMADRRQRDLGRLAAKELPAVLDSQQHRALTDSALQALRDEEVLPIAAANALRWLAAMSRSNGLTSEDRNVLRGVSARLFPETPALHSVIAKLADPDQRGGNSP